MTMIRRNWNASLYTGSFALLCVQPDLPSYFCLSKQYKIPLVAPNFRGTPFDLRMHDAIITVPGLSA